MTVCVFANGECYDILEAQIYKDAITYSQEDFRPPEFELGCGWSPR